MFLKYLCHDTAFSQKRQDISIESIRNIGIYWRPDIQLCELITEDWLGKNWKSAFLHYLTLIILEEVHSSLSNLSNSKLGFGMRDILSQPIPSHISKVALDCIERIDDLKAFCEQKKFEFSIWLNNPFAANPPVFLNPKPLIPMFVGYIASLESALESIAYMVFVDEYENLKSEQQMLINDFVKHSETRLKFSFAMKKYSEVNYKTSGSENIVETHDYHTLDLDNEMTESFFKLIAAEFVAYRLSEVGAISNDFGFNNNSLLTEEQQLPLRLENERVDKLIGVAMSVFPSQTTKDICIEILSEGPLKRRLVKIVESGLKLHGKDSNYSADDFLDISFPDASVVLAAILNRKGQNVESIKKYFDDWKVTQGKDNPIRGWIDNNLHGCIFLIYKGLPKRISPLYAGFDRFCTLARKNMRHFQDLCHESLMEYLTSDEVKDGSRDLVISAECQAKAAKRVSEKNIFDIVPTFGVNGEKLKALVLRLGQIFEIAGARYSQSEPEINHFSIESSSSLGLNREVNDLIESAKVWSVLFRERKTKVKSACNLVDYDYVLNPIFAPHFGISYRKIRKIDLATHDVDTLFSGTEDDFSKLIRRYRDKWKNEVDLVAPEAERLAGTQERLF